MYTCTHVCVYCSIIHAIQDSTSHAAVLSPDSFKLQNGFFSLVFVFHDLVIFELPRQVVSHNVAQFEFVWCFLLRRFKSCLFWQGCPRNDVLLSVHPVRRHMIQFFPISVSSDYFLTMLRHCQVLFFSPLQGICILGERLWDHGNILFLKILLTTLISHWWFLPEFCITKTIAQYLWLSGSITLYKFINCFSTAKKSSLLSPSF